MRRLAAITVTLLVLAGALLWFAGRSATVTEMIRVRVETTLRDALGTEVTVASVGGRLGRTLVLRNVRVATGGRMVAYVPRVEITYSVLALLREGLHLPRIVLSRPSIRAFPGGGGWRTSTGSAPSVTLDRLEVDGGRIAILHGGRRLAATELALRAAVRVDAGAAAVQVTRLA